MRILLITLSILAAASVAKHQNVTILRDLSQLNDLEYMLRQAGPVIAATGNTTSSSSSSSSSSSTTAVVATGDAQVSATKQGPCVCGGGLCSCCSRILLNFWKQKACVDVSYDPDEFAFTAKVTMNDRILYTRSVSGKNPRPVCVPVPRFPVVRACVRFYNIYFQGRNVHVCVNMEGKFQDTTLFKVGMDCLRLGSNGVALVKPEDGGGIGQIEFLPPDPDDDGEDEGDDYDDDYDDDDDSDEGDLFDY